MRRPLLPLLAAAAAAAPAVAVAAEPIPDGVVRLEPNIAGARSDLVIDVEPSEGASSSSETPQSLSVLFQRGFRFDSRARAGRCSDQRAENGTCPASSRIGTGTADGTATTLTGPVHFTAQIEVFLARPRVSGDLAGVVVEVREPQSGVRGSGHGRVIKLSSGQFGTEVRFDVSGGAGEPPAGVTSVEIDRVRLRVGARRTVRTTRQTSRGPRTVRRRYSLITNPRTCRGEWLIRVSARYPDRTVEGDATPPCRRPPR